MSKSKADGIVAMLLSNAARLQYGCVSVALKIHEGKVVQVQYSNTEYLREQEQIKQEEEKVNL